MDVIEKKQDALSEVRFSSFMSDCWKVGP